MGKRESLDAARRVVDEVDDAVDLLTAGGRVLPEPFAMVVRLADAVRHVVDALDDAADQLLPAEAARPESPTPPGAAQPSAGPDVPRSAPAPVGEAPGEPYDPTRGPGASRP